MFSDRSHHKRVASKPEVYHLPTLPVEPVAALSRSARQGTLEAERIPTTSRQQFEQSKRYRLKTEAPPITSNSLSEDSHDTPFFNFTTLKITPSTTATTSLQQQQMQQSHQRSHRNLRSTKAAAAVAAAVAVSEQIHKKSIPMTVHHHASVMEPSASPYQLNQTFKTTGAHFSLNSLLNSPAKIFARSLPTATRATLSHQQLFKPLLQQPSVASKKITTALKYSMTKQQQENYVEKAKEVEYFNELNATISSDAPIPEDSKGQDLVGNFAVTTFYQHYKQLGKVHEQNTYFGITPSMQTDVLLETEKKNMAPSRLGLIKNEGDEDWLKLSHMHFGDQYTTILSNGLQKVKSIKRYHLQDNRISEKSSPHLINCIARQAKEVNLASNLIGKIGCFNLSAQLSDPRTQIEVLNLEDNKLGDVAILQLLRGISKNKCLRVLNLSKNNITDKICPDLRQILDQREIYELYLHWNVIQASGGIEIFEGLKSNESVKVLDLSYNNLGKSTVTLKSSCAATIAEYIANNSELKHFDLSYNQFSRADTAAISAALANNKSIYGFHFAGNIGYVDSRGFLILEPLEDENQRIFHQKTRIDGMKTVESMMIRLSREKDLRDCCWICQGWKEMQFAWKSGISGFLASNPMFIHFNFEDFKGCYFGNNSGEDDGFSKVFTYNRMIPPGELDFFFSGEDAYEVAANMKKKFNLEGAVVSNVTQYEGNTNNVELKDLNSLNVHPNKQTFSRYDPLFSILPRTRDEVYVPPRTKKKRVKWTFPISLFTKWRPDDDEIMKRCFEFDWDYGKIPKLIKREEELAQVKQFFRENYRLVKDCYKNFATKYPVGDIWGIQNPAFLEFIEKIKVVDKNLIKDPDMNLKWVSTISSIPQADKTNPRNPVQAISRYQMMEVLVRIAEEKYVLKYKSTTSYFEAVKMLWEEHLQSEMSQQYNTQIWRSERYWVEECDLCLKHHKKIVEHVYKKYSKLKVRPGQSPFMSLDELIMICSKAGLSEEAHFGPNVALQAYNFSMMTQVDELQSDRIYQMQIVEFYEALARIAEAASLKPIKGIYEESENEEDAWPLERRKGIILGHKLEALLVRILETVCDASFRDRYPPIKQSFFVADDDSDYELVSP